ncbi:MAG: DUF7305 domain-containing protein [Myxococcales bacterium]
MSRTATAVLVSLLALGCGQSPASLPRLDGGVDGGAGGGQRDAGAADAGPLDAGGADAGAVDAGQGDAGSGDAGSIDGGARDGGTFDAGSADGGAADAGSPDGGVADAGRGDAGTAADAGSDAGASFDAGPCTPQNGACGSSSACCAGLSCLAAGSSSITYCEPNPASGCGLNSTLCNGSCVVTLTDPNNCGGCNIQCGPAQVCTSGACASAASCPQGLSACHGSCVDYQTSNANCGSCGAPCPAGQGCAGGICVQSVSLAADAGPACAGGGLPVVVGDAGTCAAQIAQISDRWAFCSCGSVNLGAPLYTDGFDSALGPYVDGGPGGSVGVNGDYQTGDLFDVNGTFWIAGDGGLNFGAGGTDWVSQDLWVGGPLANGGDTLVVGGSAWVAGSVQGTNLIGGTLFVSPTSVVSNGTWADGGEVTGAVTVLPPCDCAANQLIDVAGIVQYGATNNDNPSIGLDPNALNNGANRLDLPCGRYYLTAITSGSAVAIGIHGRTALFIGGDVSLGSPFSVTIDPQAELDLFIGGTLAVDAPLSLGSTEVPAQTRVYIAGSAAVSTGSASVVAGNFYLPWAQLGGGSAKDIYGSVFCASFDSGAPLSVHYDSAVLSSGAECALLVPDGGGADGGGACSSCRDCGNQACVGGICGACRTSADCCAPLVCDRKGSCIPQFF